MAKKKVEKLIKLQIQAGKATPAPPVGTALGPAGINIMVFCKEFNAKTQDKGDSVIPVEITVYSDKSFTFIMKQSPVSQMIKKSMGLEKGSSVPNRDKVGKLSMTQVEEIAKAKYPDMGVRNLDSAKRMVMGTAHSMGIDIEE